MTDWEMAFFADEDRGVERPAMELFDALGWETARCEHEEPGPGGITGRETFEEVVLTRRLRPRLLEFNPDLSERAIDLAIEKLMRERHQEDPVRPNREIHRMQRDGVRVSLTGEKGEKVTEKVRVVDWENPRNNDFFLASQLWVAGDLHRRRPDLVGFLNGLPVVLVELKRPGRPLKDAFEDNFRDYRDTVPRLFWYNALVILSNGTRSRVGSLTAGWEHFGRWKKVEREDEPPSASLDKAIRGTCTPERLLDLMSNFTLFSTEWGGVSKIVAKNHQYLGVNNAYEALRSLDEDDQQLGVFWHTQGSGKSFSMAFFAQKVLRQLGGYTFVVITDRVDLSDQIYTTFAEADLVHEDEASVRAQSARHLRQLLQEDHRFIFTLIQKFQSDEDGSYPELSTRNDIIVMTDEAHRSQYDTLAMNLWKALPNARYMAYTATPLMGDEEKTRRVYGDYVSVYDFKESMEDESTVPLHYENRIPELQLDEDALEEGLQRIVDDFSLGEEDEDHLARVFGKEEEVLTREERLEAIAEDITRHFVNRGFKGKGMVVSINRFTAVKMYNKVRDHWRRYLGELRHRLPDAAGEERQELLETIGFMEETDMAVVISQSQNEIDDFRRQGLDIRPHRERIENEDLKTQFKDPDNPFRLVFLCAKWLTGFDVPSCSTIYLDKPMKRHTLMQAIARANRTFGDKQNGLIVDYVGILRHLKRALSIYGRGRTKKTEELPVRDEGELVERLR
jgi:type I restriction enzyme R subunit